MVAQQAQREVCPERSKATLNQQTFVSWQAFSSSETAAAKARVIQLQGFQTQLDEHCRSMRWIMDVVAYARDRQITAGIPLADIQYSLSCMDKEMMDEEGDDRLFQIPAISLSTPADYGPMINIQSECNSTPSSPPPNLGPPIDSAIMGRRKSRDDSYLEEHHRQQNHFNSLTHHRFHHQYRQSCSDELEDDNLPTECWDSNKESKPKESATFDFGDDYQVNMSKSSYSLIDSTNFMNEEAKHRQSLTVDKSAIEDMRRCVSASKLLPSGGLIMNRYSGNVNRDLSPNSPITQTDQDNSGTHKSETEVDNYFFGEGYSPSTHTMNRSIQSIQSIDLMMRNELHNLSEISPTCSQSHSIGLVNPLGGSQLSVNSQYHLPLDEPSTNCSVSGYTPTSNSPPSFTNSISRSELGSDSPIYRPLSRLLLHFTDEKIDLIEEDEREIEFDKEDTQQSDGGLKSPESQQLLEGDPNAEQIYQNVWCVPESSECNNAEPEHFFIDNFVAYPDPNSSRSESPMPESNFHKNPTCLQPIQNVCDKCPYCVTNVSHSRCELLEPHTDPFNTTQNDRFGDDFDVLPCRVVPSKSQFRSTANKSTVQIVGFHLNTTENYAGGKCRAHQGKKYKVKMKKIPRRKKRHCSECCCRQKSPDTPERTKMAINESGSSTSSDDVGCCCSVDHCNFNAHSYSAQNCTGSQSDDEQEECHTIKVSINYPCCVPVGTVVTLKVNKESTVGEIIHSVVSYFNSDSVRHLVDFKGKHWHHNRCHKARQGAPVNKRKYSHNDMRHFSLLTVYATNTKHLQWNFRILNLQSPWTNAQLCLKYNEHLMQV